MTTPAPTAPATADTVPTPADHREGPDDRALVNDILARFPTLANWPSDASKDARVRHIHGGRKVLNWLAEHPGETWQERWLVSGADRDIAWVEMMVARDSRRPHTAGTNSPAG